MSNVDDLIEQLNGIVQNPDLSYNEREFAVKELNMTFEEMSSIYLKMCRVWYSNKEKHWLDE